jgi:hypothetical protein
VLCNFIQQSPRGSVLCAVEGRSGLASSRLLNAIHQPSWAGEWKAFGLDYEVVGK